jgi:polypeptide N-acetylgalactosaminyltransferase
VVTPVIDTIDWKTMDHAAFGQRVPAVGTFSWTMDFSWKSGVIRKGDSYADPVDSPTMAGGLFSIDKQYFEDIGTYDDKMDGWGGENLEMSFRIWQCGGRLVSSPCSHVGHIFRETHPYSIPGTTIHDTFTRNSIRVAEVWMDEYKEFFYKARPNVRTVDFGDITERAALRKKLKCKSFKWYMETVLPGMFVPDKKHIRIQGALKNPDGQCFDKMGQRVGGKAGVYYCHGQGGNQAFMYTVLREIRGDEDMCLDSFGTSLPSDVFLYKCHGAKGNQAWFHHDDGSIHHYSEDGVNCLESHAGNGGKTLKLNTCDGSKSQKWTWDVGSD